MRLPLAALFTLALAAPAHAQFGPIETVETGSGLQQTGPATEQVGVDAGGNAYVASHYTDPSYEQQSRILRRCAGSGWAPSLTAGSSQFVTDTHDLAVAPNGAAIAVWSDYESSAEVHLQSSYRPPGGDWGAPQPIDTAWIGGGIDVDIDADGNAAVLWSRDSGPYATAYASYRPADGQWEAPTQLPMLFGELAMSAAGEVAVVGSDTISPSPSIPLRAVVRPKGQPWPAGYETVPRDELTPGAGGPSALEYDPAGRLVVVDVEFSDVQYAVRSGGTWSQTKVLYDGTGSLALFDVARHPQGLVAAWREGDDLLVSRFDGAGWDGVKTFAGGSSRYDSGSVAADAAGTIVVAASRQVPQGREIWGATAAGIGGAWPSDTTRLSAAATAEAYYENPAAGGGAYLVVAWSARTGSTRSTQAIATAGPASCAAPTPTPTPPPTPTPTPVPAAPPPPPAPAASTTTTKPLVRPKLAAFVKIPNCARKRRLKVTFRVPKGQDVSRIELRLNGKRAALRRSPRIAGSVTLKRLPRRFRLQATVTFKSGGTPVRATRRIKACR